MMTLPNYRESQELYDLEVQKKCAQNILDAERSGLLVGQEAPIHASHSFPLVKEGPAYASAITDQLNHLADSLGVLGFQVTYDEGDFDSKDDRGYFRVRVFAKDKQRKTSKT